VTNQPRAFEWTQTDRRAIDLIRVLAMDAVQEAGSGHPGTAMSLALRAIPGLAVVRPADANETSVAWRTVLERAHPAALCPTRQTLPVLDRSAGNEQGLASADGAARGGYVLADAPDLGRDAAKGGAPGRRGEPDVLLIATGSEVQLALAAREILSREGIGARVVSMTCLEWFAEQDASYRDGVLPPYVRARVCVGAGISLGWHAIAGDAGEYVSLEHFGASAAYQTLYQRFGITAGRVAEAVRSSIAKARSNADRVVGEAGAGDGSGGEQAVSPAGGSGVPARDAASPQGKTVSED